MDNNNSNIDQRESIDIIDLIALIKILWKQRIFIVSVSAISFMLAAMWSLTLDNFYKSEAILITNNNQSNQSMLSQYSGFASLAGINLSSGGEDRQEEAIEMIKSRAFLGHLLQFDLVLPSIAATESYNSKSNHIIFSRDYDYEKRVWSENKKPSNLEAHRIYTDLISISTLKNGFIKISVEHKSPFFAKELLGLIISEVNSLIRQKDLEQATKAIEYLNLELSKTSLVEVRESINNLIQNQLETQMMANIKENYVFMYIEPPFIPERKSRPSRVAICLLATMLGSMIAVISVFIKK